MFSPEMTISFSMPFDLSRKTFKSVIGLWFSNTRMSSITTVSMRDVGPLLMALITRPSSVTHS